MFIGLVQLNIIALAIIRNPANNISDTEGFALALLVLSPILNCLFGFGPLNRPVK
jgi:hypothetical protein